MYGTLESPKLLDDGKNKAEGAEYKIESSTELYTIYMNISNEYKNIIHDIDDPVEGWKLLATYFWPDFRARRIMLFNKFHNYKIALNKTIILYATKLKKICEQLNEINQQI